MKTLCLISLLFISGWMLFFNSCQTSRSVAATELVSENELKISEGFTAYIATTKENGEILVVEPDSPETKQMKMKEPAWRCACGKEGDDGECKIKTTEGSDTAECRGDCFCGFKKEPAPNSLQIISKTPIQTTGQ